MERYRNINGGSGVLAYETGKDFIKICFRGDEIYLYNYAKPGKEHVEEMKALAEKGIGLSTYISQNVRENYFQKL